MLVAASTPEKDRGGQFCWGDSISGTAWLQGGRARESSFWGQSSNPNCIFQQWIFEERSAHWNCHHGWLTSSYSRIPLEHIMGNKFYSPSYMMFWGIHWGGRWDLWCMSARFWCYCRSHERLVLSDSSDSTQWCNYVKSALKFQLSGCGEKYEKMCHKGHLMTMST